MPTDTGFSRPTLAELIARQEADFNAQLPEADSRLRRSFLSVMATAFAAVAHGLYGFLDFIARQVFPDTAELEYLERWAAIWGITRIAPTKAAGTFTVTGTNGTIIPTGTVLRRSDDVLYVTTADGTIASGTVTVAIEAQIAGDEGNANDGTVLGFQSPIPGANAEGTVADVVGGADTESDDSLRERLLTRIQDPPHGGAAFDYVGWAREVAGVTRAWCYPNEMGLGTVTVRFMMDDTYADGIPAAGDVTNVYDHIEPLRPVTAELYVVAPVAVPLNFTIELNPASTDTTAVRAAVEAALESLIRREAEPGGTLFISRIREAISSATGEFDYIMTVPSANVTRTTGQITTMGAITWV